MTSTAKQAASALRRLAQAVEERKPISLRLAGGGVYIPAEARIEAEYVGSASRNELVIRVVWESRAGIPEFIHQHSDQVRDSHGNVYDAFVYGGQRTDGTWEGWIEFLPVDETLPSRRTGRETTQPNRADLGYWATGLEPLYIAGAFERAN